MTKPEQARQKAADLRREADRIEAEERKAERLAEADKIPTCPECGSRIFKIDTWTTVSMSISFEEDADEGEWCDDYESGDHTEENAGAYCDECNADVSDMLKKHGWTFYDDPQPLI